MASIRNVLTTIETKGHIRALCDLLGVTEVDLSKQFVDEFITNHWGDIEEASRKKIESLRS